jgi:hypothetical protein
VQAPSKKSRTNHVEVIDGSKHCPKLHHSKLAGGTKDVDERSKKYPYALQICTGPLTVHAILYDHCSPP